MHHWRMHKIHTYIEGASPESLQGCIKIMNDEQAQAVRKITRSLNKQQPQYKGTDVPPTTNMPPCAVTM